MTWTPTWTPEEESQLEELRKLNEAREEKLKEIVKPGDNLPKWKWPQPALDLVKEARKERTRVNDLVTRDLEKLYTWPSTEMTRPDIFIKGKENFAMFNRGWMWVQGEGFDDFTTDFTFSDRWDKERMEVTILVPREMKSGHEAPVMWLFHGGGYVSSFTGMARFTRC